MTRAIGAGDDVTLTELWADPYPTYAMLRRHEPVAWVPAVNRYLVTRHRDIVDLERRPEVFSADETGSLMKRVMGHTMLRKDGPAHDRERTGAEPSMRPRRVRDHWTPLFQRVADDLIDGFAGRGEADLFRDFAGPFAAVNLAMMLGFDDVDAADLQEWSQAMMDGTGNYGDVEAVWQRAEAAAAGVDAAVLRAVERLRSHPRQSLISAMLHAEDPLGVDEIRANVKMFIGGGLNEPRDSLATGLYALLSNPDQAQACIDDPGLWRRAFEETVRWVAPIGMYPRQTTREVELGGTVLPARAKLGIVLASANRDEDVFDDPDSFDVRRAANHHISFGGGPHYCLGSFAARAEVSQVAWPTLFRRLRNLRLDPDRPVRWGGWVFRGVLNLPVRWDP
ncbi:cytochrome P450 [Dactylosporangium sp. CA-092794]|uniref:cytochrome P450 n=1 Tax=Dactylosporangium sp. CA-092794 TaxID=3239929 RepID=UPI003D939A99